jgi:putative SOS response-associated peptidase YedK
MRRFAQAIADVESLPGGLPADLGAALVDAPDRYNIGKQKLASVLARNAQDVIEVGDMTWGLVPRWSKAPSTPYTTVTARLDRAPGSRIYAQAWKQRPCIVAMTGYYKWDRTHRPPWPRFVQRRDGLALLAAGMWEHWQGEDGQALDSFSVLTAPNPMLPPPLTPDGPVFVDAETAMDWLAGAIEQPQALRARADMSPLEAYTVSRAFRALERDDYTLLEPFDPDADNPQTQVAEWDGDAWDEDEDGN